MDVFALAPLSWVAPRAELEECITQVDACITFGYTEPMAVNRADRDPSVGAAAVDLAERKERVLHTRVPDSLDRHIKWRARSLGMSVSTVVRNVLLTTFGLVEDIVNDSTDIALAVTGQPTAPRQRNRVEPAPESPGSSEVLGWQEAVLNLNAVCDACNGILRKGGRAAIGIRERPGPRAIICPACLRTLEHGPDGATKDP